MGDDNIVLQFSMAEFYDFPIGCHISFNSREYTLLELGAVTKVNERQYDYTLTFEAPQKRLNSYKFRNMVDGRLNFTLTAQPFEYVQHIVDNMNYRDGGNTWTVGECVQSAEKTASFSHNTLMDALNQIAQLFETEWEITDGYTINLRKAEYNKIKSDRNTLQYGKGKGFLTGVSRQNSGEKAVDVLWVEGGDRNINAQTYTYDKVIEGQPQTLHANKLRLPRSGTFYYVQPTEPTEKGTVYSQAEVDAFIPSVREGIMATSMVVTTDADGFGIHRRPQDYINNGYEDSTDLTDIYPHKVLTISSVYLHGYTGDRSTMTTEQVAEMSNRFWDIFADANEVNYNDYLIGGEQVTIVFNTGMLAGKEFNLADMGDGKCYDPATHKFLIQPTEIDGITMPDLPYYDQQEPPNIVTDKDGKSGTGYVPKVGDEFAVFHVMLPNEYIEEAERELLLEACHYLYKHSEVEVEFSGTVDPIWSVNKWDEIERYFVLGGYINFKDDAFCSAGRLLRILSIKTYLTNPHAPELTLSNSTVSQGISSELKKIAQNQTYTDTKVAEAMNFAQRRSFRDQEETQKALQEWGETINNYWTSGISPVTVQTMQLLVGDKSLQYQFGIITGTLGEDGEVPDGGYEVKSWNPQWDEAHGDIVLPFRYGEGADATDFVLRHRYYTNPDGGGNDGEVKQFTDGEFPYWGLYGASRLHPEHPQSPYYLYIKADTRAVSQYIGKYKPSTIYASFELVEIKEDTYLPQSTPEYYYFLCGILNSEVNGSRSYSNVFGSVEISGSQIRLSQIVSNDTNTFIDLVNNVIQGNINIKDGALTSDLVIGKENDRNYGGFTGGNVLFGEQVEGFYRRLVRFWIGNRAKLTISTVIDYVDPNTGEVFSHIEKILTDAKIVFFADGSFLFRGVEGRFFMDTTLSTWAMRSTTSFRAYDIDSRRLFARQKIEVATDIDAADRVSSYIQPSFSHFSGNMEGVKKLKYVSLQPVAGLVPTLIWSGRIWLRSANRRVRWNASMTQNNKTYKGNVPFDTFYSAVVGSGNMTLAVGSPQNDCVLVGVGGWYNAFSLFSGFVVCQPRYSAFCRYWHYNDVNRPRYTDERSSNWTFAVETPDNGDFDLQIFILKDATS